MILIDYVSLKELSELTGIKIGTLKYYIKEGILKNVYKKGCNTPWLIPKVDADNIYRAIYDLYLKKLDNGHMNTKYSSDKNIQLMKKEFYEILKSAFSESFFSKGEIGTLISSLYGTNIQDKYISMIELSKLIGISTYNVNKWCRTGKLKNTLKIKGQWHILRSDAEILVNERKQIYNNTYVSIEEASKMLNCSKGHISQMISLGKLTNIKRLMVNSLRKTFLLRDEIEQLAKSMIQPDNYISIKELAQMTNLDNKKLYTLIRKAPSQKVLKGKKGMIFLSKDEIQWIIDKSGELNKQKYIAEEEISNSYISIRELSQITGFSKQKLNRLIKETPSENIIIDKNQKKFFLKNEVQWIIDLPRKTSNHTYIISKEIPQNYIGLRELEQITGLSYSKIYNLIKNISDEKIIMGGSRKKFVPKDDVQWIIDMVKEFNNPKYITKEEVLNLLNISSTTLSRIIKCSKILTYKSLYGNHYFSKEEILTLLENRNLKVNSHYFSLKEYTQINSLDNAKLLISTNKVLPQNIARGMKKYFFKSKDGVQLIVNMTKESSIFKYIINKEIPQNYISLSEVKQITGLSYPKIYRLTKNIPDEKIIMGGNRKKFVPKDDIQWIIEMVEEFNNPKYITKEEVLNLLNISSTTLSRMIKSGDISVYKPLIGNQYFMKEEILTVLGGGNVKDINDYINVKKVSEKYSFNNREFREFCYRVSESKIQFFKKRELYIHKSEIDRLLNLFMIMKMTDYTNSNRLSYEFSIDKKIIDTMCIERKIVDAIKIDQNWYIKKNEKNNIENLILETPDIEYIPIHLAAKMLNVDIKTVRRLYFKNEISGYKNNVIVISKNSIKNYLWKIIQEQEIKRQEEEKLNEAILNYTSYLDKYYTLNEVVEIVGGSRSKIVKMIQNDIIKNAIKQNNGKKEIWLIPKIEVDNYLKNKFTINENYYTANQACGILDINLSTLNTYYKNGLMPNTYVDLHGVINYWYYKDDIENLKHKFCERIKSYRLPIELKEKYKIISNNELAYEYFINNYVNFISKVHCYPETLEAYKKFVKFSLNKSKAKILKNEVRRLGTSCLYLFKNIDKEIFAYTNSDLINFLEKYPLKVSYAPIVNQFIKFCNSEYSSKSNFNIDIKRQNKYDPKAFRPIYSMETFMKYYEDISNLDHHIPKAIKSSKHSQLWIYVLFHFFTAWRAQDIIDIPNIQLEQFGISDLTWFNKNKLTYNQAHKIINQYYIDTFIANKTGVKNGFRLIDSLIIPFGSALAIAELHRRKNNQDKMMFHFTVVTPKNSDFRRFFKNKDELNSFSNLKACRSLITHAFEFTSENSFYQSVAFEYARLLRNHKSQDPYYNTSNTTPIYVNEMNSYEKDKNISKYIFEAGNFGWIYNTMLKVFFEGGEIDKQSLDEKVKLLVNMQNTYSIIQVEGLNKFLLNQQRKKMLIVEEILNIPKMELREKIRKIFEGLMPSRIPECQCFLSGSCPYSHISGGLTGEYCTRCEYHIPNRFFLISLKLQIYRIIDYLNSLDEKQEKEKVKLRSILNSDMLILREALDEEYGLGKHIVDTFIDRQDLFSKLNDLK